MQDFIITWQRNLSPSCVAVKIPESKVHVQSAVPQKATIWLSSSLFHSSAEAQHKLYQRTTRTHIIFPFQSLKADIPLTALLKDTLIPPAHTESLTPQETQQQVCKVSKEQTIWWPISCSEVCLGRIPTHRMRKTPSYH